MNSIQTSNAARSADLGLLLMRLMLGVVFVFHGGQKLFGLFGGHGLDATAGWMDSIGIPFPMLSATLAGSAEFFGGLALVSGVGARWMAVPLAFTMFVAASTHTGFDGSGGGMEYPLTLAVLSAGLALTGPGRLVVRLRGRTADHRARRAEASAQ